ncbi:MAG: lipopolysaccharide biosynthesis protein [Flavobacteriales bacterium]|nr:lipopolysaccharide biosynthesis protein [Flavobacteriales bacterium]
MEPQQQPPEVSLIDRSISGMVWVTLDKIGGSGVNFIITVLLARLLFPADFGLVAMAMVFFEFSSVFVESGFSTALIREKDISGADKSTVFIYNMGAALVSYALLFACAPWIAAFYGTPALVAIVRVMGLSLIVDALSVVRSSVLVQRVDFRSQALARFGAVVLSGALGVWMAWEGFGVWSLVARVLVNGAMLALLFYLLDPWKPELVFSTASFRRLFGFGSRILAAGLLDKFFSQAYKLVIGKFFAAVALGFYTQAGTFVNMAINTLFRPVQTVSYPVLARLRDDLPRLKSAGRTILRLCSFVVFPALVLLGVLAEPVIGVLIGEKWYPAAPYLRLLCVAGATIHISSVNLNVLLVLGRSDLSLRLEVIKKVNIALAIIIGLQYGLLGLVIGEAVVSFVNLFINAFYSRKLLAYTPIEQLSDIWPTLALSAVAGAAAWAVQRMLPWEGTIGLLVLTLMGVLTYLALHVALRTHEWRLLTGTVLPKVWTMTGKGSRLSWMRR